MVRGSSGDEIPRLKIRVGGEIASNGGVGPLPSRPTPLASRPIANARRCVAVRTCPGGRVFMLSLYL